MKNTKKKKTITENTKKANFREIIRNYIREILAEEGEKEPKQDETLVALQKKVDDLNKATKKIPQELQSKLKTKIKKAQADIDSYTTDSEETKKK